MSDTTEFGHVGRPRSGRVPASEQGGADQQRESGVATEHDRVLGTAERDGEHLGGRGLDLDAEQPASRPGQAVGDLHLLELSLGQQLPSTTTDELLLSAS
jgi:hypothetical protein